MDLNSHLMVTCTCSAAPGVFIQVAKLEGYRVVTIDARLDLLPVVVIIHAHIVDGIVQAGSEATMSSLHARGRHHGCLRQLNQKLSGPCDHHQVRLNAGSMSAQSIVSRWLRDRCT